MRFMHSDIVRVKPDPHVGRGLAHQTRLCWYTPWSVWLCVYFLIISVGNACSHASLQFSLPVQWALHSLHTVHQQAPSLCVHLTVRTSLVSDTVWDDVSVGAVNTNLACFKQWSTAFKWCGCWCFFIVCLRMHCSIYKSSATKKSKLKVSWLVWTKNEHYPLLLSHNATTE